MLYSLKNALSSSPLRLRALILVGALVSCGCDEFTDKEPGTDPPPGGGGDNNGGGGDSNGGGGDGSTFDPASQTGVTRNPAWPVCNTQAVVANATVEGRVDGLLAPLSPAELDLYRRINSARAEEGLHAIPLSPTLTGVARAHAWDSNETPSRGGSCNMHSWSTDIGAWETFCYTSDHAQMAKMHSKPKEIFGFNASAYENSSWSSGTNNAETAFNGWMSSAGHRDVILNQGIWANMEWRGIGVAIDRQYAHLWVTACADDALFPAAP